MAKKKRKHYIKLNNKIKELFGSFSFDEGIATLSDDNLLELIFILDIESNRLDRDACIRTIRRVWSEGNYNYRKVIIDHLCDKKPISLFVSNKQNESVDKIDKIIALLSKIKHTHQEEQTILESFIDAKPAKITLQKIKNKLAYIRFKKRVENLQSELDITFDTNNEMEFYHPYYFHFEQESFTKTLLTKSNKFDLDSLLKLNNQKTILEYLRQLKEKLVADKNLDIKELIFSLKQHKYLQKSEAMKLLKELPTDCDLRHTPIDIDMIEKIVYNINKDYFLIDSGDHFVIESNKTISLFDILISYRISKSYTKQYIYTVIWNGNILPFKEDIDELNKTAVDRFEAEIIFIKNELEVLSRDLNIDNKVIQKYIKQFIEPQLISSGNLKIKDKTKKRIFYHFLEYLRPIKEKKMREELLAKTIQDFKQLFPLARSLQREIVFHVGPTNSGKTYQAIKKLSEATTGYYLAPLRLLALEGYENLKSNGIICSLVTGEEEIINEDSTHISSTIEMLNNSVEVDICVIDEIQMIDNRDRGWAWANALIGAPAKKVILTGSSNAMKAIIQLAEYLNEPLEVVEFKRKNPLTIMNTHTPINHIESKTAIVTFSRKEVLSYKQRLSKKYSISVIYGNLSPEVRREEARKFRDNESDILIATDAISMGLNLPIKTILFARDNKFDGLKRRELTTTEVLQISGRAGRYGMHEHGYIGALDSATLQTISSRLISSLPDIDLPFSVMASLEHIILIGEILGTDNILDILNFFAGNMEFDGPFVAANIDSMLEIAKIVESYNLDLRSKYHLSCAPISAKSPYIESAFRRYLILLEKHQDVPYIPPRELPSFAHTNDELLNAEDRVKEISLYLWLSFKFEQFKDTHKAIEARSQLNSFIERSLQKGDFLKKCQRCGKILDFSYRFSICDRCYSKGKRGYKKNRNGFKRGLT